MAGFDRSKTRQRRSFCDEIVAECLSQSPARQARAVLTPAAATDTNAAAAAKPVPTPAAEPPSRRPLETEGRRARRSPSSRRHHRRHHSSRRDKADKKAGRDRDRDRDRRDKTGGRERERRRRSHNSLPPPPPSNAAATAAARSALEQRLVRELLEDCGGEGSRTLWVRKRADGRVGLLFEGAAVVEVHPGSPASEAGVCVGDRIFSVCDRRAEDDSAAVGKLLRHAPDVFELVVQKPLLECWARPAAAVAAARGSRFPLQQTIVPLSVSRHPAYVPPRASPPRRSPLRVGAAPARIPGAPTGVHHTPSLPKRNPGEGLLSGEHLGMSSPASVGGPGPSHTNHYHASTPHRAAPSFDVIGSYVADGPPGEAGRRTGQTKANPGRAPQSGPPGGIVGGGFHHSVAAAQPTPAPPQPQVEAALPTAASRELISRMTGDGELDQILKGRNVSVEQVEELSAQLLQHNTSEMTPDEERDLLRVLAVNTLSSHLLQQSRLGSDLKAAIAPAAAGVTMTTSAAVPASGWDAGEEAARRVIIGHTNRAGGLPARAGQVADPGQPGAAAAVAPGTGPAAALADPGVHALEGDPTRALTDALPALPQSFVVGGVAGLPVPDL